MFGSFPVLAGDQWWPRTRGGRLRLVHAITHVLHHNFGHFVKGNKRNAHKNRLIKFSAWEAEGKQFYQPIHMPTSLHFRGMTIFQRHIIKYRNKHVQIAILIFSLSRKAVNCNQSANESILINVNRRTRVTIIYVCFRRNM